MTSPRRTFANGRLGLADVSLHLGPRLLLGPIALTVEPGEIVTLMGPSGCGKSSLLAYVCGVLDPCFRATGSVALGGRDLGPLPPERRGVGILFQDDLLFPHLTVAGNLAFGLPPTVSGRRRRRAAIERALEGADLAGFADRPPATLSGGQRARVALLRTVLADPSALLLDEPFAHLDAALRSRFRQQVFGLARDRGLPTLLVTHDADDAAGTDRIVELPSPP
jgi:putative thiamine transport system ATP-binding protein